jgi:hypothetical protein
MRYQAGTAIAESCTERTAWRRVAAAAVVAGAIACSGNAREERASERGTARTSTTGTRAIGNNATSPPSTKPPCPPTGAWQLCSVVERLDRAGLAPRQQPGGVREAPLSSPGVAFLLGRSELRVFLYADRAARERDQARLDRAKYVAANVPLSMQLEPTLIASENLLAILRSRNDQQRERVSDALTAGPPQRSGTKG